MGEEFFKNFLYSYAEVDLSCGVGRFTDLFKPALLSIFHVVLQVVKKDDQAVFVEGMRQAFPLDFPLFIALRENEGAAIEVFEDALECACLVDLGSLRSEHVLHDFRVPNKMLHSELVHDGKLIFRVVEFVILLIQTPE